MYCVLSCLCCLLVGHVTGIICGPREKDISSTLSRLSYRTRADRSIPEFNAHDQFPLTESMMNNGLLGGREFVKKIYPFGFDKLFRKLSCGENVTVAVHGGSFTAGHGLAEKDKNNAWQFQFLRWLKDTYPHSHTIHLDETVPSSSSTMGYSTLRDMITQNVDIDLVLFDYSMNDYMLVWTADHSNSTVLAVNEDIVRLTRVNDIALIYISEFLDQEICDEVYTRICDFYGIPLVSYRKAVYKNVTMAHSLKTYTPEYHYVDTHYSIFYPTKLSNPHPPLPTHTLLADYLVYTVTLLANHFHEGGKADNLKVFPNSTLPVPSFGGSDSSMDNDDELSAMSSCYPFTKQLSSLTGGSELEKGILKKQPAWQFTTDVVGKPSGWIAGGNSVRAKEFTLQENDLEFMGQFIHGRVTLTYLQSYENSGKFEVYVRKHRNHLETGPWRPTTAKKQAEHPHIIPCCTKDGKLIATHGAIVDTFNDVTRASEVVQKTLHFAISGVQVLIVKFIPLTLDEFTKRKGDKVKLLGITIC